MDSVLFVNCAFYKSDFSLCFIDSCDFSGSDFKLSEIKMSRFNACVFDESLFDNSLVNVSSFSGSSFRGSSFDGAQIDFSEYNISDFTASSVCNLSAYCSNFSISKFAGVDLRKASLINCNMVACLFDGAVFQSYDSATIIDKVINYSLVVDKSKESTDSVKIEPLKKDTNSYYYKKIRSLFFDPKSTFNGYFGSNFANSKGKIVLDTENSLKDVFDLKYYGSWNPGDTSILVLLQSELIKLDLKNQDQKNLNTRINSLVSGNLEYFEGNKTPNGFLNCDKIFIMNDSIEEFYKIRNAIADKNKMYRKTMEKFCFDINDRFLKDLKQINDNDL